MEIVPDPWQSEHKIMCHKKGSSFLYIAFTNGSRSFPVNWRQEFHAFWYPEVITHEYDNVLISLVLILINSSRILVSSIGNEDN